MTQLAPMAPGEIDCASDEAQAKYLSAMLIGQGPLEAAASAGVNPLAIYLARFADPHFNQLVQLAELAQRDQALRDTLRKACVASGTIVEAELRDPDTGEVLLDDDFNPVRGLKLAGSNGAVLSKLLDRLVQAADKPQAPVSINVTQSNTNNAGEAREVILVDPMQEQADE